MYARSPLFCSQLWNLTRWSAAYCKNVYYILCIFFISYELSVLNETKRIIRAGFIMRKTQTLKQVPYLSNEVAENIEQIICVNN